MKNCGLSQSRDKLYVTVKMTPAYRRCGCTYLISTSDRSGLSLVYVIIATEISPHKHAVEIVGDQLDAGKLSG